MSYAYQKCQFSYSDLNYSIEMRLDKLSLYLIEKDTFETAILVNKYHGQLV